MHVLTTVVGSILAEAQSLSLRVLHGQAGLTATASATPLPASGTLAERLDAIEAMVLRETLLRHRWNKTRAAKELGNQSFQAGNYEEALDHYTDAIDLAPPQAEEGAVFFANRAACHAKVGGNAPSQ